MRILTVFIGFLTFFAPVTQAQAQTQAQTLAQAGLSGAESPRTLSVSGHGSVKAVPDMATITLGVAKQATSPGAALDEVARISQAIFTRLQGAGIAPRDMQTSDLSLQVLYSDQGAASKAAPRIVGYRASNMITVRVMELDRLGAVLDQVTEVGANSFDGLQFGLKTPEPLADKARVAAVEAAMARAALLAGAAGVRLGPVLTINDQSGVAMPVMGGMSFGRAEPILVVGGELSVSASVSMVFAISD